ncbi:hypothetical protein LCGC14_1328920 [marine sediment metagenome]|uniref:Uncharacterized protein n=1 Tax=marine sediment metagenome TaxID=412755 RepID=A0A0F9L348_9ZZZZ
MILLTTSVIVSFFVGMAIYKKFGFSYYQNKIRQLIITCDRYKSLSEELINELDNGEY